LQSFGRFQPQVLICHPDLDNLDALQTKSQIIY